MPAQFQPVPIQGQKFTQEDGNPTEGFRKWLELIPPAISMAATQPVPTAANSAPTKSGFACDNNFLYVVTPSGLWKKVPLIAL
jgi:hypothetical protein